MYLGVDSTGNEAVFLVGSSLTLFDGEAACKPSNDNCATVSMEPGEVARFRNGQNEDYALEVNQIREVSVRSAARAARKQERSAAGAASAPGRRFLPPVISDLLVGGRS